MWQWLPQRVPSPEKTLCDVCRIYEILSCHSPAQVVGTIGVNGVLVTLQRPFPQLLALLSLAAVVVGQCQPRRDASHQTAEALHVCHALVATVPCGRHLHTHVLLQFAARHVAQHGLTNLHQQRHPVVAVARLSYSRGRALPSFQETHILACCQQPCASAEVGLGVLVNHLSRYCLLAYGLHISYPAVALQRCGAEVVPCLSYHRLIVCGGEQSVVHAPCQAVAEECRAAGLASRSLLRVHHRACPVALGLLQ